MEKTKRGLPNTCSNCGNAITEDYWYAKNDDEARSGLGICNDCAEEEIGKPETDDLTSLKGIGVRTQTLLNEFGIYTFEDLANADPKNLADLLGKPLATAKGFIKNATALI